MPDIYKSLYYCREKLKAAMVIVNFAEWFVQYKHNFTEEDRRDYIIEAFETFESQVKAFRLIESQANKACRLQVLKSPKNKKRSGRRTCA